MLDLDSRESEEAGTGINGTLIGVGTEGSVLGRVLYCLGASASVSGKDIYVSADAVRELGLA
ncbi:hypothetical protein [Halolamina sp. C58]|uniref:hypothetical protein n=1 Tax=Halolamina sp. C58 TaxID=3421640 RepID=UPI003EBEF614